MILSASTDPIPSTFKSSSRLRVLIGSGPAGACTSLPRTFFCGEPVCLRSASPEEPSVYAATVSWTTSFALSTCRPRSSASPVKRSRTLRRVASPLVAANTTPKPTPIPNPVKKAFIKSPRHQLSLLTCSTKLIRSAALRGLHSLLNLLLFGIKGRRFLVLILDHPVHFAPNQDCKTRHVQPEHQNNNRREGAISGTVAIKKMQIQTETKRSQQPKSNTSRRPRSRPIPFPLIKIGTEVVVQEWFLAIG